MDRHPGRLVFVQEGDRTGPVSTRIFTGFFISNWQISSEKYKGFITFRVNKYLCGKISPSVLTTVQKWADFSTIYTFM